jgi:hypothetical protein
VPSRYGKQTSEPANTSDPARAEFHRLAVEARIRARCGMPEPLEGGRLEELAPAAALERFLAYLLSLRRA